MLVLKHAVTLDGVVKLGEGGVEQVVHLLRKRRLELRLATGDASIMKGNQILPGWLTLPGCENAAWSSAW